MKKLTHIEESDLGRKIGLLKGVGPKVDWVIFTKNQILGEDTAKHLKKDRIYTIFNIMPLLRYLERPAIIMPVLAVLVVAGIALEQTRTSVPGAVLYPVKAAVERTQLNLASNGGDTFVNIELAHRRLDDLRRVVESNQVKNLSPSIREFELSVAKASQELAELVEKEPEKALQASKEVVQLQKEKLQIEQILGTTIGEEQSGELELATKRLVENELVDLESRSLTEEQEVLFQEAKTAFEDEDYETALERIWTLLNV